MHSYVHACICECMYGWVCIYYISIFCIYPYSPRTNRHPDSSGLSFRVYIFNFDINNYLMRVFVECRDARQICTHIHVLKCIVLTHWARVVCTIYCVFLWNILHIDGSTCALPPRSHIVTVTSHYFFIPWIFVFFYDTNVNTTIIIIGIMIIILSLKS